MKKLFSLLALMIATVAVVATGYTLTRPAKASGAGTYNDKAASRWSSYSLTEMSGQQTVTVTANSDGTYNFSVPGIALPNGSNFTTIGDLTIENVTATENEDGSISYSFDNTATVTNSTNLMYWGNTETPNVTMSGKSKDGKLYMVLNFKPFNAFEGVYIFGEEITSGGTETGGTETGGTETGGTETGGTETGGTTVEGTVVGTDGYAPAGNKFTETATIDWETQKLAVSIDVTGCSGENENILSVGKDISNWNGECFHLYYSRSSYTLQINYCTGSNNPIRKDIAFDDADELNIEISKENGLYVNGQNCNYINGGALTDDMTNYSVLWGLSEIQVGSQEGKSQSHATYNYIRVQDIQSTTPVTPEPTPVIYTAAATVTYDGTTSDLTDQTVEITETAENTYTVVYKNLTAGTTQIGDFTAEGVTGVTDADGYVNYEFDGNATISNANTALAMFGITDGSTAALKMVGKSKDGSLVAKFTATALGQEAVILYNGYTEAVTPEPEPEYTTYNFSSVAYTWSGNWTGGDNGNTDAVVTDKGEGLYDIVLNAVNIYGNYEITFPNVPGTVQGEGVVFSTTGATITGSAPGTYGGDVVMTIEGKMLGEQLYLYCSGKFGKLSDDPFVITVGTDFEIPTTPVTPEPTPVIYTADAKVTYSGTTSDLTNQTVEITETAENTYTVVYKGITAGTTQIGDFTAEGVTGVTDADGYVNYEFDGNATISNANTALAMFGITDGSTAALKMVGKSKDGSLVAKFTATALGQEAVILYNGYTEAVTPEPEPTPVIYTAAATVTYNGSSSDLTDQTVEITETAENTYTVVYKGITIGSATFGDLTAEGVTGTLDEEGYINYSIENGTAVLSNIDATSFYAMMGLIKEGQEFPFSMVGKSKDGSLVAKFTTTYSNAEAVILYNGYTDPVTPEPEPEPEVEGKVVIADGYQPAGSSFVETTTIDWDTQKLVASIDVSDCTNDNENILSVGGDVSEWFGMNIHIYYTPSKTQLTVYYLDTNSSELFRMKDVDISSYDTNLLLIEISKENGITVNGNAWNGTYTSDFATVYENLFALSTVEVGSQEGSTRSNATYNYVRVQDINQGPETGINTLNAAVADGKADIYTINGVKVNALQKGINIVRMNGKTIKVVKK